jgi:hypothetical protein
MLFAPAYAEGPQSAGSSLIFVLICAGLIGAIAAMALAPIAISGRRGHAAAETIVSLTILWCVIAAGVSIYMTIAQIQWNHEYTSLVMSGYYDPQDTSGAPRQPWGLWLIVVFGYAALLLWAFLGAAAPEPPASDSSKS